MKEFKLHPFKNILHVETLLTDKDPRSVYFGLVSLAAESKTTQCDFCRLSLHTSCENCLRASHAIAV